ncbi:MAG: glycosyltransferase family 2 protein [Paludibacteraceae bacterium]|nr:glycosyltransferase family 2 protein [Paludibacteraceae bacterium]
MFREIGNQKKSPVVSIISPNYNCAQFIGGMIASVQAQTYQDWELIIVDDCSSDESCEAVMSYAESDSRIRLLRNPKNMGAAQSRNYALREARGRWIAFLDSDDLWHPEKLEKQLRFMVERNLAFSYTQYIEISESGENTGVLVSGPRIITQLGMSCFCWPGCLTVMYDTNRVGLIQIADIKKNNDYAIWLEVSRKTDCYLLPEVLAKYRRGRNGSVSSHSWETMVKWHYKLWREAIGKPPVLAFCLTLLNVVCGFWKKNYYVKCHSCQGSISCRSDCSIK